MVELLEYSLVFLVSSMMVGFSIAAASSFQGSSRGIEERAAFSGVAAAAWEAVEHGNSSVTIMLSNSSVSCAGGELNFSSPVYSAGTDLPVGCGFGFPGLDGQRTFRFTSTGGWLELSVS